VNAVRAASPPPLAWAVPQVDGWRQRLTGPASAAGTYKEWMHFCVCLPGSPAGHLLLNVNVSETRQGRSAVRVPRLMIMAATGAWSGSVESFTPEAVVAEPGGLDVRLGETSISWRGDAFHLSLQTAKISGELALRPLVLPTVSSCVTFGQGRVMHWVVIPRLEASGWVLVGGRRLQLERALAYHDHNWGHFQWGGDLSWEWGFVNPLDARCPWSAVFVRVSDDRRHRTLSQGLLVWKRESLARTFQNRELRMELQGTHAGARPVTVPGIASLLVPGAASGVPARVRVEIADRQDRLRIDYTTESKARIALASEVDPFRSILLNETCGRAMVTGSLGPDRLDFEGTAVMEFVRG
jgi:hypothetical protein